MMFIRKFTHDRAMAQKSAEIAGLLKRAKRAEAAFTVTTEIASQRAARIIKLEADLAEQSSKITTLSNLNAKLERELRPFTVRRRGERGRFVSLKSVGAGA